MCKRKLHSRDLQDITYKSQDLRAEEEQQPSSPLRTRSDNATSSSVSTTNGTDLHGIRIYSEISPSMLQKIKSIDLPVSYSTKIDSICRTLLYLRETDPGAKSVIFSQFSDFLDTLADAFRQIEISYVFYHSHLGTSNFRRDSTIEVILLDAKSDSSGLNLVNATHVFLCEPLINTAIELQAIARVHRIGQMRPTTVWMILIADSVEEAVYRLSAERRLQHIVKVKKPRTGQTNGTTSATTNGVAWTNGSGAGTFGTEADIDAANSRELESQPIHNLLAKGSKGGGEVVDTDDLWTCLFRKPRDEEKAQMTVGDADLQRILRAEAAEDRILNGVDDVDDDANSNE
jgi:E3 ubiquitin-protein ligase SHPRH